MIQGIVIRGTTPEHSFDFPYDISLVDEVRVTYGQGGKAVFTKTLRDCKVSEGKISVSLIQEETFLFIPKKTLQVEIRVKFKNGKVVSSEKPISLRVIDSMNEEVLD